jgi:pimeloyl-ACP methyl ester carboxylesterase
MALYVRDHSGAPDETTLLLLHGLGSNGAVWDRMVRALAGRWRGRILIPDLRGHGRSDRASDYALGRHAADVAGLLGSAEPVSIVGHSMGGAIAVALASGWFALDVRNVFGLSIKPVFTPDELETARAFAHKPPRRFASRDEAIDRFLRTNGLTGIAGPDDAVAVEGVRSCGDAYELAADPRTMLVAGPPLAPMLSVATAPIQLATGDRDDLASATDLRSAAGAVAVIGDAGHNAHVERAELIADLIIETAFARNLP